MQKIRFDDPEEELPSILITIQDNGDFQISDDRPLVWRLLKGIVIDVNRIIDLKKKTGNIFTS